MSYYTTLRNSREKVNIFTSTDATTSTNATTTSTFAMSKDVEINNNQKHVINEMHCTINKYKLQIIYTNIFIISI
jgi:hypothetical protein